MRCVGMKLSPHCGAWPQSFCRLAPLAVWLALAICTSWAKGEPLADGGARREAMFEAQQAIPFDRLTQETQMRIWSVAGDASIYRRLPSQRIECDPELFIFLVRRPEVVVNIWQLMGISQVSARRTGPYTLQASDGAGTQSVVDLTYGSRDIHLVYAEGFYEGRC